MRGNIVMKNQQTSAAEKKDTRFVFIAIVVALALTLSMFIAAFSVVGLQRNHAQDALQRSYLASLTELGDSVDEVELRLSKLSVGLSKRGANENLDELSTHASVAVCALSRLPVACEQTYGAVKLLNQIIDFAAGYDAAIVRGADTADYVKSAQAFRRAADILQERVRACLMRAQAGEKICTQTLVLQDEAISDGGDGTMQTQPVYPEMIYDGPFSDSRTPVCFKGLEDLEEISEAEALDRFENLFHTGSAQIAGRSFSPAAYEISGGGTYASISVNGGMVLSLTVDKTPMDGENLSEEDAFLHAAEYAAKLGYGDLRPVWFVTGGGAAFVNMAPENNGAILYTDLVKVKISLSDGSLLGLEATGFCRNHVEREIRAGISETTAARLSGIEHDSVRLCVIPDHETEAVCFEVHGYADGMEFYVYVDAVTGEKIQALKVVEGEGGKLTE